ncbi:hypothetical protein HGH92_27340 [Chitinophaga varians]|uniref:Uncharacterized protein n=1 Tax=Chitinophaga varians TaxID=2202339 RepID=A0A847RQU1_9BACT|nr:hypothetical protein [Chitinophaga varians]NLR68050.1 hypothetical protein [Chitinophaga varians]
MKNRTLSITQQAMDREAMKKIRAAVADCQRYGEACNTEQQLNCCSGLYCVDAVCGTEKRRAATRASEEKHLNDTI